MISGSLRMKLLLMIFLAFLVVFSLTACKEDPFGEDLVEDTESEGMVEIEENDVDASVDVEEIYAEEVSEDERMDEDLDADLDEDDVVADDDETDDESSSEGLDIT